jgi:hypothetical protein
MALRLEIRLHQCRQLGGSNLLKSRESVLMEMAPVGNGPDNPWDKTQSHPLIGSARQGVG